MNFWQVAAGETGRDYSDVFLRYGVMLIGPGDPGPYFEREEYYGNRSGHTVGHFAKHVARGDIIILKKPYHRQWQVQAVGKVIGDYEWVEQFDDVHGWDLQHCRKVEWVCPPTSFIIDGLARGTLRRAYGSQVRAIAEKVLAEGQKQPASEIPPAAKAVSDEDLINYLIDKGLRPGDAETVIQAIWRTRRLGRWYNEHGKDLSEHEIRTFLIVPILLALGWSEQKLKIEWRNMDLSFFSRIYEEGDEPCMILESKRIGEGLSYAEEQVQKYARDMAGCSRLMVSDGIRYYLYVKQGEEWDFEKDLTAYMNLLRLKDRHPYLTDVGGAPQLFVNLMPR